METENLRTQLIPLQYHFVMLQEEARMRGFRDALEAVIPEGGRVLDLGGGTGVLSFFAAGRASKVWCVERQADMAAKAADLLHRNGVGAIVQVVEEDAMSYLPPEPVDVVICEMLHSALLCEKQLAVLHSFKERYLQTFGPPLPRFVPEATVLGVEPVERDFHFFGYQAPIPVFQAPGDRERTHSLGSAVPYAIVQYSTFSDFALSFDGVVPIAARGTLNAVRIATNNALAVLEEEGRSINWQNQNLILPLAQPIEVEDQGTVQIRFAYEAGAEIADLERALTAERL